MTDPATARSRRSTLLGLLLLLRLAAFLPLPGTTWEDAFNPKGEAA